MANILMSAPVEWRRWARSRGERLKPIACGLLPPARYAMVKVTGRLDEQNMARDGLRVRPSKILKQPSELYHSSVRYQSLNG